MGLLWPTTISGPYWNMAWGKAYRTSSSVKEYTYVSTEFNLYNTKDEKLLWSGETESVYWGFR